MFSSDINEQWLQRVKHSTTRQIRALQDAMRHPAYALARLRNASLHAEILAICDAELRLRADIKRSVADILPPVDLNLTKTTRE